MRELATHEGVLLLALDDEKGRDATWSGMLDAGLVGAALADLIAAGAVRSDEDGRLHADGPAPEDPFLAAAHAELAAAEKPRKADHWVSKLPGRLKPLKERAAERLVAEGVLEQERSKVLGLFGRTSFPERDPGPERALRAALRDVLVVGREPTEAEARLVALLSAIDAVGRAVERPERREAKKRAKAIAAGDVGSEAVRRVIRDLQTTLATMTVVIASAGAVSSS